MATRTFTVRTEPHQAIIGNAVLLFRPEVDGAEFVEEYAKLRAVQGSLAGKKVDEMDPEEFRAPITAAKMFIGHFLMDDAQRVLFEGLTVPDRITVEMLEWIAELYGSGSKERPTG